MNLSNTLIDPRKNDEMSNIEKNYRIYYTKVQETKRDV